MSQPTRALVIGRIVHYEHRDFESPAMVVATNESIYVPDDPQGFIQPPPVLDDGKTRAHLMVFSPIPGKETLSLELNVPYDDEVIPETWHWPDECEH